MSTYAERFLGPKAIQFVRNRLSYGHTLSQYLMTNLNLDTGKVSTFLPPDVTEKQLYDFESGGVLPMPPESEWRSIIGEDGSMSIITPTPTAQADVINLIKSFLELGEDQLCIFENSLAKPDYPYVSRLSSNIVVHQDEVYHYLSGGDVDDSIIDQTIKEAEHIPVFIGALTFLSGGTKSIADSRSITSEQLRFLAEKTQIVIIGAYDGEGYVIWKTDIG